MFQRVSLTLRFYNRRKWRHDLRLFQRTLWGPHFSMRLRFRVKTYSSCFYKATSPPFWNSDARKKSSVTKRRPERQLVFLFVCLEMLVCRIILIFFRITLLLYSSGLPSNLCLCRIKKIYCFIYFFLYRGKKKHLHSRNVSGLCQIYKSFTSSVVQI